MPYNGHTVIDMGSRSGVMRITILPLPRRERGTT
jgi:hypothetical protein